MSDSSDSDFDHDQNLNLGINDQLRLAIIRGLDIDHNKKLKLKGFVKHKEKGKLWSKLGGKTKAVH